MMTFTPKAIIHDSSALFALIEVLNNHQVAGELLKDLNEEANRAVAAQTAAEQILEKAQKLDAELLQREKECARQRSELATEQQRLADAQKQHQFTMESEHKANNQLRQQLANQIREHESNRIAKETQLRRRSWELDEREKAVVKRELEAVKKDESLTAREQALAAAQDEHAKKVAKLRELAA